MHKFFLINLLALLLHAMHLCAQPAKKEALQPLLAVTATDPPAEDYYQPGTIRYEDHIYKKNIKTVQLRATDFELSQPLLNLNSEEKLKLSFDDLEADVKNYSYTFIHCNADWQPSGLMPMEYVNGFADAPVNNYQYAFNTLQQYTHYAFVFPSDAAKITKSGNYILKIYLDGDPDNLVITKRFMIYDNKLIIESRVKQASIVTDRDYKQELDFTIDHSNYRIANPYNDLKVVITQNNRWDNAKTGLRPVYVKDAQLVYDYDEENVFNAENEFRNFDIKSIRYHSEHIYNISTDSSGNKVVLNPSEKRNFKRYYSQPDINGDFLIKIQEGNNSDVEADYCHVAFFLPYDAVLLDGNLYVFGAFNGWKCSQENLMHYNTGRSGYECTLYLKQGYYNYQFAFLKDGETAADVTLIEGSHYETENDYTIYIYHRPQGVFYDQLIGVKRLNSMKQ